MEITIKTKFGIGDTCFGFHNGELYQFKVDEIELTHKESFSQQNEVSYKCTAVPPKGEDWCCTFLETFPEYDLYTREDVQRFVKEIEKY